MLSGVSQKVGSPVEKLSDIPAEYVSALMGTLAAKMDAQAKAAQPVEEAAAEPEAVS
jgi:hypothetical protein